MAWEEKRNQMSRGEMVNEIKQTLRGFGESVKEENSKGNLHRGKIQEKKKKRPFTQEKIGW